MTKAILESRHLWQEMLKWGQFYESALNDYENAFRNITKTHEKSIQKRMKKVYKIDLKIEEKQILCWNQSWKSTTPQFLQRVSIAWYAERCTSYSKSVRLSVRLSVCLSVARWHCEIRPTIIYDDMLPLVGLWLIAKWMTLNDLEWLVDVKIHFWPALFVSERLNVKK